MSQLKILTVLFSIMALGFSAHARTVQVAVEDSPGAMAGAELFRVAEESLQEEVKIQCGVTQGYIPIHDMKISVITGGCGSIHLDPQPGVPITFLSCYPSFTASGSVECPN